jgi:hypothetical protein
MQSHHFYFRLILSLLLMLFGSVYSPAQDLNRRLESEIRQLVSGFKGEVGVYVNTLRTGKTVEINADTTFPTASIVKVPLLMGIMDRIGRGSLKYDDTLTWLDTIRYDPGEDIIMPGPFSTAIMNGTTKNVNTDRSGECLRRNILRRELEINPDPIKLKIKKTKFKSSKMSKNQGGDKLTQS